jgi:hypothetical protein
MEKEAKLVELGRLELSVPPAELFRTAFTPELSALPITPAMADRVAELKGSCFHKVPSGAGTEQRKPVSAWAFIGRRVHRPATRPPWSRISAAMEPGVAVRPGGMASFPFFRTSRTDLMTSEGSKRRTTTLPSSTC